MDSVLRQLVLSPSFRTCLRPLPLSLLPKVPRGQGGPGRLLRLHERIGRDFDPDMVEPPTAREQLVDLIRELPPLPADRTAADIIALVHPAERIGYFRQYVVANGVDELVPLVERQWPDMAIELFDLATFDATVVSELRTMRPATYDPIPLRCPSGSSFRRPKVHGPAKRPRQHALLWRR